ncbi:MAG TPA: type VI secretion system protein TssA [Pyrinomonadaceae bacterium]|nr:type VI secretion system protein TssA [Pyrinomonadaceae bacterium]
MSAVATGVTAPSPSGPALPPAIIDTEALLKPISSEKPSGENLRYSPLFDDIREARRADDTLAQGDWRHDPKVAQWSKVVELTTSALANQSKDLQICAYMAEALVHLYGFVGLRDGLKVMRGLHENFWDTVYPQLDGQNMTARGNALSLLDKSLEIPLKSLRLTKSGAGDIDYSYLEWMDSVRFDFPDDMDSLAPDAYERLSLLKAQAEADKKTTGVHWRKAKGQTPRVFYEETYALLNQCWEEYEKLDQVMDDKFDRQTPGLGALKRSLDEVRTLVEKIVKEKRVLEPDPVQDAQPEETPGPEGQAGLGISVGPVHSRQEALQRLAEVARYFEVTEPHSPVAYLVQRAIKWGQMPLEVWLEDVIKDGAVLGHLRETLGIKLDSGG